MSQINDDRLLTTGGPTYNDGMLAFYQANGATSNCISDAELEYLIATGQTKAQLQDMWDNYLTDQAKIGALDDKKLQFFGIDLSLDPDTTLAFNYARDQSLTDIVSSLVLTFTRASQAAIWDSGGVLQVVANDVARFDHDPATGVSLGFLNEEERTNLVTWSEDLTQWLSPVNSILSRTEAAPDGTNNATLITDDATLGTHHVGTLQLLNDTDIARYAIVKKGTARYCYLSTTATPEANTVQNTAIFDFDTETFTQEPGLAYASSTFRKLANGYYQLNVFVPASGGSTNRITVGISNGPDLADVSYSGVGDTMICWAGQYENALSETSYIKTSAVTETRAADVCFTNDMTWYNQPEGTFYCKFIGGSGSERLYFVGAGNFDRAADANFLAGGVSLNLFGDNASNITGSTANLSNKVAHRMRLNDYIIYGNGIQGNADIATTAMLLPTKLSIGSNFTNINQFNGHIQEFGYAEVGKDNAYLQDITSE